MRTILVVAISALLIVLPPHLKAQCYATGYKNGNTFITSNPGGIFNYNFINAGDAAASDNIRASASSILALLVGDTYYLRATGFGFTIPSYAAVCGITVQIERRAQGVGLGAITDQEVRLIKAGTISGDNKKATGDWPTSDFVTTYGSSSDKWSLTFTPAEVNDPNFGVAIAVHITGLVLGPSAEIDNIRVNISYNPVLPIVLGYFKSGKKNNNIHLEWKTTEEEDNGQLIVQRSANNTSNWTDIKSYALSVHNHDKVYRYEDIPAPGIDYSYRLKMINALGTITYSAILFEKAASVIKLFAYPNPAVDYIVLTGIPAEAIITISDIYHREWITLKERSGASRQINIQQLPKGIYCIQAGDEIIKFVKK